MVKEFPYLDNIISADGEVHSGVMTRIGIAVKYLGCLKKPL